MEIKESPKLDVTPYVGKPAMIVKAIVEKGSFGLYLKLSTDAVDKLENGDPLVASKMLGFAVDKETGDLYIAKDSKMDKFMQGKKIDASKIPDTIEEGMELDVFHGVKCVCQKNDKGFLEIA